MERSPLDMISHVHQLSMSAVPINKKATFQKEPPIDPRIQALKEDRLKLSELVAIAKSFNVPSSGTKSIVRDRLLKFLNSS